jgi:hypothetical protein
VTVFASEPLESERMRQLRDEAGVEWMVYAVTPVANDWRSIETLPETYRGGWLCFESATEKRRLTPVPLDWEALPLEQLTTLLGEALQVRRAVKFSA